MRCGASGRLYTDKAEARSNATYDMVTITLINKEVFAILLSFLAVYVYLYVSP